MNARLLSSLPAGLLLLTSLAHASAPNLDEIRQRMEAPERNKCEIADLADLRRLSQSEAPEAAKATVLLVRAYRKYSATPHEAETARERLAKFARNPDGSWNYGNAECCLEHARIVARTDLAAAIKVFDYFGTGKSVLLKTIAAEAAGDVMVELGRPADAIDYYQFALKYAKADEYAREDKLVEFALKRIDAALKRAKRVADVDKFAEEFVLYREAEQQRKWGNYKQAIPLYEDLIKRYARTVFARAAEVYIGHCFQRIGNPKEAETRWKKVIDGEQWGLYRGEALVALGELRLNDCLDLEGGCKFFRDADAWLDGIATAPVDFKPVKPPEQSAEVTVSPQETVARDNFGNVLHSQPRDGALVNHLTAPWYLDDLRLRVAAAYGFALMVQGKLDEARVQFERYRKLDELGRATERAWGASFSARMDWNLTENRGCLRATPAEAAAFVNPKRRLAMFIADYAYEQEQFEEAERQYRRLMDGEFGKLSAAEEAYVYTALAFCAGWRDSSNKAAELLSVFEKKWQATPSAPIALMACGNYLVQNAPTRKKREAAIRYYDLLVQRYPDSAHAERALYRGGELAYILGNKEDARRRFKLYLAKYPNGFHKDEASVEYHEKDDAETWEFIRQHFPGGPAEADKQCPGGMEQARRESERAAEKTK
jgi:tetratricopeptide (TPR) repeat protein